MWCREGTPGQAAILAATAPGIVNLPMSHRFCFAAAMRRSKQAISSWLYGNVSTSVRSTSSVCQGEGLGKFKIFIFSLRCKLCLTPDVRRCIQRPCNAASHAQPEISRCSQINSGQLYVTHFGRSARILEAVGNKTRDTNMFGALGCPDDQSHQ